MEKMILDIEATFGKIKFLGGKKEVHEGRGRDRKLVGIGYSCYSEKQRSMHVILPPNVLPKVNFEAEVELVNHYSTFLHSGGYGDEISERMLYADNLVMVK